MKNKWLFLSLGVLALVMLVAAQCGAQPETVTVVETVVVEKEVEKVVTQEVEVEKVVTQEVEVVVTKEVEVEKVLTSRGQGGTLTILYWQASSILNPYLSGGTKDLDASAIVLDPLAYYDETGQLVPVLAQEIPTLDNGGFAEDLTSITWKLKEGLAWSDGTPVTAEDVVFTWEYCAHPDMGCNAATQFDGVASVEALDEITVQVNFEEPKPFPYGPFVSSMSPIIQKAQFQDCMGAKAQECTDQNQGPIGTGPYKVREFRANDVVIYDVNENFRDPNKPFFSEVIFKGGGDAAAAARAVLETGEADYAWNLQVEPAILKQMELAGNGKVETSFSTCVERLMVNFTNDDPSLGDKRSEWTPDDPNPHPFNTDPAVRQALSLAIDRNAISSQLYGAGGRPTCNVIPGPPAFASTANDACLVQDIGGANALLDEAGWVDSDGDGVRDKDGVDLSIIYQTSTNPVRQKTQALIKQWWAQIGVETELKDIDAAVYFGGDPASPDTYGKFYTDIEMYTNCAAGIDLQSYLGNWQSSEIARAENQWLGNNIPRYNNPEYDALFDTLTRTADPDERADLIKQLNDMLMQDYVMIPLVDRGNVSAHRNDLLGVRLNAWDTEMWNIQDWSRASQ